MKNFISCAALRGVMVYAMEWHVAASLIAAVVTFVALTFEIKRERRKQSLEIKEDFRTLLGQLSERIDKIERKQAEDVAHLHNRVSESRNYERDLLARVSSIDGNLIATSNIIKIITEHMMAQTGAQGGATP